MANSFEVSDWLPPMIRLVDQQGAGCRLSDCTKAEAHVLAELAKSRRQPGDPLQLNLVCEKYPDYGTREGSADQYWTAGDYVGKVDDLWLLCAKLVLPGRDIGWAHAKHDWLKRVSLRMNERCRLVFCTDKCTREEMEIVMASFHRPIAWKYVEGIGQAVAEMNLTPLEYCAEFNTHEHIQLLYRLLQMGADFNTLDAAYRTRLLDASTRCHSIKLVRRLWGWYSDEHVDRLICEDTKTKDRKIIKFIVSKIEPESSTDVPWHLSNTAMGWRVAVEGHALAAVAQGPHWKFVDPLVRAGYSPNSYRLREITVFPKNFVDRVYMTITLLRCGTAWSNLPPYSNDPRLCYTLTPEAGPTTTYILKQCGMTYEEIQDCKDPPRPRIDTLTSLALPAAARYLKQQSDGIMACPNYAIRELLRDAGLVCWMVGSSA